MQFHNRNSFHLPILIAGWVLYYMLLTPFSPQRHWVSCFLCTLPTSWQSDTIQLPSETVDKLWIYRSAWRAMKTLSWFSPLVWYVGSSPKHLSSLRTPTFTLEWSALSDVLLPGFFWYSEWTNCSFDSSLWELCLQPQLTPNIKKKN